MANEQTATDVSKPRFCKKDPWTTPGVVTFTFGNGTVLTFELEKVNSEIKENLALHGASQKIGDSFAGVKENYAEGIANAQEVINQLYAGDWSADREGGGPRLAELAEAIARIKQVDVEKARAAVEAATDDQRKAWRSNGKVKHMVATIRAEKAQKALEGAATADLVVPGL